MALRLHRITDEQWQRLAAGRGRDNLAPSPPRAAIGAIEIELRALERAETTTTADDELPRAAAG